MADTERKERSFSDMEQDRIDNETRRLDLVEQELHARIKLETDRNATYERDVASVIVARDQQTQVGQALVSAINHLADAVGRK